MDWFSSDKRKPLGEWCFKDYNNNAVQNLMFSFETKQLQPMTAE